MADSLQSLQALMAIEVLDAEEAPTAGEALDAAGRLDTLEPAPQPQPQPPDPEDSEAEELVGWLESAMQPDPEGRPAPAPAPGPHSRPGPAGPGPGGPGPGPGPSSSSSPRPAASPDSDRLRLQCALLLDQAQEALRGPPSGSPANQWVALWVRCRDDVAARLDAASARMSTRLKHVQRTAGRTQSVILRVNDALEKLHQSEPEQRMPSVARLKDALEAITELAEAERRLIALPFEWDAAAHRSRKKQRCRTPGPGSRLAAGWEAAGRAGAGPSGATSPAVAGPSGATSPAVAAAPLPPPPPRSTSEISRPSASSMGSMSQGLEARSRRAPSAWTGRARSGARWSTWSAGRGV